MLSIHTVLPWSCQFAKHLCQTVRLLIMISKNQIWFLVITGIIISMAIGATRMSIPMYAIGIFSYATGKVHFDVIRELKGMTS